MNSPAEDAASHAVRAVEWGTWLRSVAGAGLTVIQINDWVTLFAGVLTAAYTLLKIVEWFQARADRLLAREAREEQTRSLERLHELWEIKAMQRTRPGALTPEERHATSPTPLFDDTYSGHDNGAGR